ncbi:MAG: hypothetical protein QOI98_870 [Solirubrobacteraceae bacterium]|jgi:hypothetical protein|nr:hypothetical protein [Solirubrobacteraceae bacterium]
MAESWSMEGPYIKTCNCDPGCPCDFNQAPTHGHCHGMAGMKIEKGHFGDVSLDGVKWLVLVKWPGRMDEGDGDVQPILDADASQEQLEALGQILSGANGGTFFQIVDAVCPHKKEPVTAPIEFEWDIDARTARVTAGDVAEATVETLRGIDPPDPYRIRVHIPGGFEYVTDDDSAEVALATKLRSTTEITMDVTDGNANLAYVHYTPNR